MWVDVAAVAHTEAEVRGGWPGNAPNGVPWRDVTAAGHRVECVAESHGNSDGSIGATSLSRELAAIGDGDWSAYYDARGAANVKNAGLAESGDCGR